MELNRWKNFEKRQQLLMLGAEFMRAKVWQGKDQENFLSALERALELIDLTLADEKWRANLLHQFPKLLQYWFPYLDS